MSLINDALKRARRAQNEPPPLPPPDQPLQPAEGLPAKPSELPVLLIICVLLVLGLGALVVTFVVYKRNQAVIMATPTTELPAVAVVATGPRPPPSVAPAAAPPPQVVTPPVAPSASAAPAASRLPLPKLQGIFYSPSRPWALVDGRTVFVGNHVGDFTVLAIAQDSVTLGAAGQTNVLTLPE